MKNVIEVIHKKRLIAFIIKADFKKEGIEFLTPSRFQQQLAYMHRPRGYVINPHNHPPVKRSIRFSQEVIFVRKGRLRVDFYDNKRNYVESRVLQRGDVLFLASGGHGFEFMRDGELIEVKQGPFLKKMQSVKFEPLERERLRLRK